MVSRLQRILTDIAGVPAEVQIPSHLIFGDVTTNVAMKAASEKKEPPFEAAQRIVEELKRDPYVKENFGSIEAVRPGFINFFYSDRYLGEQFSRMIREKDFGKKDFGKGKTVVIEYSSPNTNKPLHLGHLRNDALGMSLANMLTFFGYRAVTTSLINDRGIHIMKSLWAYLKYGKGETPESVGEKGDHFVGDFYVKFNHELSRDKGIADEARDLLRRWEAGDAEVRKLWAEMNQWVYDGWKRTYELYGSRFDVKYYESELYDKGRKIIKDAEKKKLVHKNEKGALVVDLSTFGLGGADTGEKVLIRPDGTTVYITQDIYLAVKRYEDYHFDKMIYVVGDEQIYHFKVLFILLRILGYPWVDRCFHYYYGQVTLPSGKMKSREGTVVDADDLLDEMIRLAKEEVKKRQEDFSPGEIEETARAVALAAVKYWFLKTHPKSSILFDPKESLSFEGTTGPYLLYAYVRLRSIMRRAGTDAALGKDALLPKAGLAAHKREKELIRKMVLWPLKLEFFFEHYQPNVVCEYLYELAHDLNAYYHKVPVLKSEGEVRDFRLQVVSAGSTIIKKGLELLNIQTVERM